MVASNDIATMDPAERAGYVIALLVFLAGGILLLVFGIRNLMRRSAIQRRQRYGASGFPPGPYGPGGQQPYGQAPDGGQPPYSPNLQQPQWNPQQQLAGKPEKLPSQGAAIAMIVFGAILLLGILSSLANASSGTN
jgi:hypothetical protein